MERLTRKSKSINSYVLKDPSAIGCMNAVDKLGDYEEIEEHIGVPLKEFEKLCDKHIPDDCKNPGKAIVLTDEDAYEFERLKEMYSDPEKHDKIKELSAKSHSLQCALKAIGFLLGKENGVAYKLGYNKAIDDFVAKYKFCDKRSIQCRKALNCADCIAKQLKAGGENDNSQV